MNKLQVNLNLKGWQIQVGGCSHSGIYLSIYLQTSSSNNTVIPPSVFSFLDRPTSAAVDQN